MGRLFTGGKDKHSYLERLQNCSVGNFPVLLTPPTSTCFACSRMLTSHNKPCNVVLYTLCGKRTGFKFSLRCEYCKFNCNYDHHGNKSIGWCLYQTSRPLVEVTSSSVEDLENYFTDDLWFHVWSRISHSERKLFP